MRPSTSAQRGGAQLSHIPAIVDAARRSGADAVHPGYGFLAENAGFAAACRDAGLTFIGPSPEAIALMGSKTAARPPPSAPACRSSLEPKSRSTTDVPDDEIARPRPRLAIRCVVKAVAGGGGKGMRVVADAATLCRRRSEPARSEAGSAFGDTRRLPRAAHRRVPATSRSSCSPITHGTVVPFVERECSIQRRHQKVVEESPSMAVDAGAARAHRRGGGARSPRAVGYTNAGTIEFLLDEDGSFYFLEMNTRLQVEHPVTEMVTGIDLVQWQIRIARGERLDLDPARRADAARPRDRVPHLRRGSRPGLSCRRPGSSAALRPASGPGIRDDGGVSAGYDVPVYYDSMIAKLVAWGGSRDDAIARMSRALARVPGARHPHDDSVLSLADAAAEYRGARYDTTYLDRLLHRRAAGRASAS